MGAGFTTPHVQAGVFLAHTRLAPPRFVAVAVVGCVCLLWLPCFVVVVVAVCAVVLRVLLLFAVAVVRLLLLLSGGVGGRVVGGWGGRRRRGAPRG
jgi:hypothetical protein